MPGGLIELSRNWSNCPSECVPRSPGPTALKDAFLTPGVTKDAFVTPGVTKDAFIASVAASECGNT
ncbi:hypothetical protein CLV71_10592 [Actinophytocola oryzae]|uniref:Uncharacterized protein n=1 Tax=Actinophytocola oryzae TaxID=502181 RepID=A0A4R7VQD7_9PSEU|nr:hypothetical protein CLV71_10592 [Actinophytocola oryzae]